MVSNVCATMRHWRHMSQGGWWNTGGRLRPSHGGGCMMKWLVRVSAVLAAFGAIGLATAAPAMADGPTIRRQRDLMRPDFPNDPSTPEAKLRRCARPRLARRLHQK